MLVKIKNNHLGYNGACRNCGKYQKDGEENQPLIVYHKDDNEKRGHNSPICSLECAQAYIAKLHAHKQERRN